MTTVVVEILAKKNKLNNINMLVFTNLLVFGFLIKIFARNTFNFIYIYTYIYIYIYGER